ncbi:hypothetical protein BDN71DRAFT_1496756 [Pleurotus eryngii]|uniref:Uncharacterized protein n=1 Tax=Pleurotus eryngii TaxID=5323 RepID=A0A9P6DFN0_PLEER|nr:hypothetical protein BDN71DRAFT_1496756 [Pleurotus eryngii]
MYNRTLEWRFVHTGMVLLCWWYFIMVHPDSVKWKEVDNVRLGYLSKVPDGMPWHSPSKNKPSNAGVDDQSLKGRHEPSVDLCGHDFDEWGIGYAVSPQQGPEGFD